jgi:anti-anti-sigma factor
MEIKTSVAADKSDVNVVEISGRLDGTTSAAAQPVLLGALEEGAAGVILHMASLEFISSAGLRILLTLCKNATAQGKRIAMVGVQPSIYKIFKIAALDKIFRLFETESDALRELWP